MQTQGTSTVPTQMGGIIMNTKDSIYELRETKQQIGKKRTRELTAKENI